MKYRLSIILAVLVLACNSSFVFAAAELTPEEMAWLAKAERYDKEGWIYLYIEGEPFERGFQRGYLTASEIENFGKTLTYRGAYSTSRDKAFFIRAADSLFGGKIPPEYEEEMRGMTAGMQKAGKEMTYREMLMLCSFIDLYWYWWSVAEEDYNENGPGGCSAFVATGDATADGKIVLGHNTWTSFELCQYSNILIDIKPAKGNRIFMQTWGPTLFSGTDFFITDAGIVGCETTIGGFDLFDFRGTPVFIRTRQAMQYAQNIDEWANIMIEGNNGAYANSWLLGDIKTNEIGRLELGLRYHNLEKKNSGFIHGSNVADDRKILRRETNASYDDIRLSAVARRERWKQLMKEYFGKIDAEVGKRMLADHYDVYMKRDQGSARTLCGHSDLDDGMIPGSGAPFTPSGAMDGKVVTAEMAKNMEFWAIWGSSCGTRDLNAARFLDEHTQFDWMRGYLPDVPPHPWVVFTAKP